MNTIEKAKFIRTTDLAMQDNPYSYDWNNLVRDSYENAKGKGYGWIGIAEEDPEVIEELYPKVLEYITK